jgi:diguanylate cyclase (GGDEF)-like protein
MRIGLEDLAITHAHNAVSVLTFSAGLAVLDPGRRKSAAEVLKEADSALYRAKQLGRNRVEGGAVQLA